MNIKQTLITFVSALGALAIVTTATFALPSSTLEPQGTPGENTQYTLYDIYMRLLNNMPATRDSGFFVVPNGDPVASSRTLTEIYNIIPTIDPTKVAAGTTYLGVAGTLEEVVTFPTEWSLEHPDGYVAWQVAMDYCDITLGDGWKLPTYLELINAFLTGERGFQAERYWSRNESPYDSVSKYVVYRSDQFYATLGTDDQDGLNAVRCAR